MAYIHTYILHISFRPTGLPAVHIAIPSSPTRSGSGSFSPPSLISDRTRPSVYNTTCA
ncbi:hypothetical protein EMPG_15419 [Blastomyces silverae]|uniref:Uncharacterized protein n=1 Tax=Blastomyces silverae TaxID=2060906 RepID=A0A0H1BCS1_9EURO|nr:hypothetical protein EMPG_15419 [Blastomyces silverae]